MRVREMKQWVPLFQDFINSPSSEVDASHFFQQQHNPNTSSFLSLLLTPTPSTSSGENPLIFIQTLPLFVQTRILSFLTIENPRFCHRQLRSIAVHILNSDIPSSYEHPGFWVHHSACILLDAVSSSKLITSSSLQENDRFHTLPDWLQGGTTSLTPLLSWLPISRSQLPRTTMDLDFVIAPDEPKSEAMDIKQEEVDSCSVPAESLDSEACNRAIALKSEILASVSTSDALHIVHDIRKLFSDAGPNNELALLSLIEPWEGDDETLSVLLSNLSGDGGSGSYNWPAHVLCSISLPKLLNLRTPASRVLLASTVSFCKLHQVAAVEALIFPLVLQKEGINIVQCDGLTRVIKECLHKSHVSAFCQKLLCGEGKDKIVCLPCHRDLISDELVWTEPMFTLFQHILNQDVYLTPDSVEQIVSVIVDVADKFSASLKFGNFFLCFVSKCKRAAELYKLMLGEAAEKTNTFVTKSIMFKLDGQ